MASNKNADTPRAQSTSYTFNVGLTLFYYYMGRNYVKIVKMTEGNISDEAQAKQSLLYLLTFSNAIVLMFGFTPLQNTSISYFLREMKLNRKIRISMECSIRNKTQFMFC